MIIMLFHDHSALCDSRMYLPCLAGPPSGLHSPWVRFLLCAVYFHSRPIMEAIYIQQKARSRRHEELFLCIQQPSTPLPV